MDSAMGEAPAPVPEPLEREGTVSINEREKLLRLLNFIEKDKVNLGDVKRRLAAVGGPSVPSTPQASASRERAKVVLEEWPELHVKPGQNIIIPTKLKSAGHRTIGGTPISLEMAIELRMIVYGSVHHSFTREWRKSTLAFQDIDGPYPYGLQTQKCHSRGLALCVQGFMLKRLFFEREYNASIFVTSLKPNNFERRRALVDGICEMLWQAGDRRRCCVALMEEEACFDYDYRYRYDNVTEKCHLFEFKKFEDVQFFVKRNLERFQLENGCGLIQFLYSLVLSRTIRGVRDDLEEGQDGRSKLLTDVEDVTVALLNLALTGRAVPNLHNGEQLYDADGHLLPAPKKGAKERSPVGFLYWDKGDDPDARTEVGSMLKTPKAPIWLTKVNQMWGLLFSTNLDLVSDWRIENRFTLHYYTGLVTQPQTATLNVETRRGRPRPKTSIGKRAQEEKIPPLEHCIMTKWYGANIAWKQMTPFI